MRALGARVRRRPPRRWPSWPWQVIGGGIAALIALALVAGGAGGAAAAVETKLVLAQDSQLVAAHQSWLLPLRDQPLLTFLKGPVVKVAGFGAAARIGMPDTGLISYTEMLDQGRNLKFAFYNKTDDLS